jgi:hypothetical protein
VKDLKAFDVSSIERLIKVKNVAYAMKLLEDTHMKEAEGGMLTEDKLRRKFPAGVFLTLMRNDEQSFTKDELKFILEEVQAKKREERKVWINAEHNFSFFRHIKLRLAKCQEL